MKGIVSHSLLLWPLLRQKGLNSFTKICVKITVEGSNGAISAIHIQCKICALTYFILICKVNSHRITWNYLFSVSGISV